MYAQRAIPLLTAEQRKNHITFYKHLHNNLGMRTRRKILWIHYNEKWFYGWLSRATAKNCELLGLEKTHTYLYHKCHTDKVMCVAFTAYGYDSSFKNGGKGVKLGFYCMQGARVAKKQVKQRSHDENGSIHFDGEIIREKGDAYLIDCNVTGSDEETSDHSKFSLMSLFRDHVFPKVLELVIKGSDFEDYLPVFQGDNASPHIDATYHNFVKDYCK